MTPADADTGVPPGKPAPGPVNRSAPLGVPAQPAGARVPRGLYILTPETGDDAALLEAVHAALRGGAATVQYRNKTLPSTHQQEQAGRIGDACRQAGALFLVNDSVELAAQLQADGVHLGRDDTGLSEARARLGPRAIIGVSCYDSLQRALDTRAVADYCAFGSVAPSTVKPAAVRAPLTLFGQARDAGLHAVAIGGIDETNAAGIIAAGAQAIAVITAVFGPGGQWHAPAVIEARARALAAMFMPVVGA